MRALHSSCDLVHSLIEPHSTGQDNRSRQGLAYSPNTLSRLGYGFYGKEHGSYFCVAPRFRPILPNISDSVAYLLDLQRVCSGLLALCSATPECQQSLYSRKRLVAFHIYKFIYQPSRGQQILRTFHFTSNSPPCQLACGRQKISLKRRADERH